MAGTNKNEQIRRFRPGDMARIVHSCDTSLLGEVVIIEEWRPAYERWAVCLVAGPACGLSLHSGDPIITSRYGFRDSSLEPIECKEGDLLVTSRREQDLPAKPHVQPELG